ncbi:UNVERIFIED_ORG: hypothetical protein B5F06_12610 [Lacrimispora saccharolytica]|nr:hypothetical protein CLS_02660 [[Clostridium] cf. saccharolyticum K10]
MTENEKNINFDPCFLRQELYLIFSGGFPGCEIKYPFGSNLKKAAPAKSRKEQQTFTARCFPAALSAGKWPQSRRGAAAAALSC